MNYKRFSMGKLMGVKCSMCREYLNTGKKYMIPGDSAAWSCQSCGSTIKMYCENIENSCGSVKLSVFQSYRDETKVFTFSIDGNNGEMTQMTEGGN